MCTPGFNTAYTFASVSVQCKIAHSGQLQTVWLGSGGGAALGDVFHGKLLRPSQLHVDRLWDNLKHI